MVGSISDPFMDRLSWSMGRFAHSGIGRQIRTAWTTSEFSLTWQLARNALPLFVLNLKAGLVDMPDCHCCSSGLEETAEQAFYYCERVRLFWYHVGEWTTHVEPKQVMLLDLGYFVDNVLPQLQGEKRVMFLTILAVAGMVIWTTRKNGLYDGANFSHRDLILLFRHQLRVKIRCDRKRFDCITFDRRWVHAASLVIWKEAMLESSFPSSSNAWRLQAGSFGISPSISRIVCFLFFPS